MEWQLIPKRRALKAAATDGSPRIHAGTERLRAFCVPMVRIGKRSEKASRCTLRFSIGNLESSSPSGPIRLLKLTRLPALC